MELKIAQIATLPERLTSLRLSIDSIYKQVDKIYVSLNGHQVCPDYDDIEHKINWVFLDNSLGDAAKAYGLENRKGFIFLVDDDLQYPHDYASYMLSKYEQHKGCIITLHGRVFQRPVRKSHGGHVENYRCLNTVVGDHITHIGGSGVMLFHTDDFRITTADCPRRNMMDIWVGKKAHELGVKIVVVEHKAGWLKYLSPTKTIWGSHTREDEAYQVKILQSFIK